MSQCPDCGGKRMEKLTQYRCPDCGAGFDVADRGWISVEDRLPEIGDEVMIYSPTNGFFISQYDLFPHFRDGDIPIFEYQNVTPTHWMPLPEPPEEDE